MCSPSFHDRRREPLCGSCRLHKTMLQRRRYWRRRVPGVFAQHKVLDVLETHGVMAMHDLVATTQAIHPKVSEAAIRRAVYRMANDGRVTRYPDEPMGYGAT